ncbi:MAG: EamA family transporter, partial [Actinobacteria bacterium]|nr:EamA family transporter [Actinomycetota bacterium]NIS33615.1 EamA family transporter [Actinomycetota bacterium]NIU68475.1 EamA family transporter [Actinomycetota bacterium]NIW30300.1 EamA family transporter [Actinomycetota bacterium]NIX22726.1 EamA family transporter [Actinomycetota bacterium]
FMLVFLALEIVPPGRSSILIWTSSLWTVPIAAAFLGERMSRLRWAGLLAGVAGILFVFEPTRLDWGDSRVLLGHGML